MDWVLLVISSACFVFILLTLDILGRAKAMNQIPLKVFRVIRAPGISDYWKEKVLPRYSLQLLSQSLLLFGVLLVALVPFLVSSVISMQYDGQFAVLLTTVPGIVVSTLFAILVGMLLSRGSNADYGAGSRMLHQLVLGNSFFGETLFDIEKTLHGSGACDVSAEKHVFVAGLARAGTTILMRTLYENGKFQSLTYRDMPFILAPNSWRRCSKVFAKKGQKQERAHGDGIEVDYDSPEALEEVFWRTFCKSDYIKKDMLIPMQADSEALADFRRFIAIVLKPESDKRYLSKNNNNILRLGSISQAFPNAIILVPFRDPVQQAYSLRRQHRKFAGDGDPFTKKYMTWLVHHEFGADHRPFVFNGKARDEQDTEDLNYWVRLWIDTYSFLLENLPTQVVLLSYEALCDDTKDVWQLLSEKIGLEPCGGSVHFMQSYCQIDELVSPELLIQSAELYKQLERKAIGYTMSLGDS
jgi:hypothetical protein